MEVKRGRNFDLQSHLGKPFFSYRPKPLEACDFRRHELFEKFEAVDVQWRNLRADVRSEAFEYMAERACPVLDYGGDLANLSSRIGGQPTVVVAKALANLSSISARDIANGNAQILGADGCSYRKRFIWIGASHPSEAWYVAPSPRHVSGLMANLLCFANDRTLSAVLRSFVVLLQFLMIHPFADGNGRTGRALFTALLLREFGSQTRILESLCAIWEFRAMRLHGASLTVRDTGDWSDYLRYCLLAVEK